MKKTKLSIVIIQAVVIISILATSYTLWLQTLHLQGTVTTGTLNTQWNINQCYDTEPLDQNYSDINANIENTTLNVFINNAYPPIIYFVEFEIQNMGTIPLIIYQDPLSSNVPGIIALTNFSDTQLRPNEKINGTLSVQLDNNATPLTTYTFSVTYIVTQWNKNDNASQENISPIAVLSCPASGYQGEQILFNGTASYDPDGQISRYEWDFTSDGTYDINSTHDGTTRHTYTQPGTYQVTLRVTDNHGATNLTTTTILISQVDIYVDDDYNETTPGWQQDHYVSIQDAINTINTGTIFVYNGIYNENVLINKPVTLVGENNEKTIIDGKTKLNIGGYTVRQYASERNYTIPDNTYISPGDYVIIARECTQTAFETYWGTTLNSNVLFINSQGKIPSINGDETFELLNEQGITLDGPTGQPLPVYNTAERIYTTADATQPTSWRISPDENATPGWNTNGDNTAGLIISEYSDTTGTGNYVYEFVELYYDATGTNNVITITADHVKVHRFTIRNSGSDTTNAGITIQSNDNTITNNNIVSNNYGIYIEGYNQNHLYNNYFTNTINAYDSGNNEWNAIKTPGQNIIGGPYIGGNYWNDYLGTDTNHDGIGDIPYGIPGGDNQDNLPLR